MSSISSGSPHIWQVKHVSSQTSGAPSNMHTSKTGVSHGNPKMVAVGSSAQGGTGEHGNGGGRGGGGINGGGDTRGGDGGGGGRSCPLK